MRRSTHDAPSLRRHQRRREDYFALNGGLNLVDPPLTLRPGELLAGMNYEQKVRAGYGRIGGIERFDGQPAPSAASYYILNFENGVAAVSDGDTITGLNSGATGVVLVDAVVESGSYGGGDAVGYIVFTKLTGNFSDGEDIQVSAVTKCNADGTQSADSADSTSDHQDWRYLAAEEYRADIDAVPGSGQIRGVHVYEGVVYAFRNNAGATACVMHKSSASGWVEQDLGRRLNFTAGTAEFAEEETLTGGTSSATATIKRVVVQSGDWSTNDAVGYLILYSQTGTYQAETATSASGSATIGGNSSANTLPANGRYEAVNHNFYGHTETKRMYGVNGVGNAFEWDGAVFTPIVTGMTTDTPAHIEVHNNHLFLSFPGGSLQHSSPGGPYVWSAVLGAAELAIGEEITAISRIIDNAMAVVGRNRTYMLYGSDVSDWDLRIISRETGAIEWTFQLIGRTRYLDDRGVTELVAAQEYGNFRDATISHKIQPLLDVKRPLACASTISRTKNQYRLFFTDGTGLIFTFNGNKLAGITQLDYGMPVRAITSLENSSGEEVIYFGSDDGYVYQADKGTSFDGEAIEAWLILPYYHYGTPSRDKQFRKITPEFEAGPSAVILVQPDFSYGDPNIPVQSALSILGGGGAWNVDNWGEFLWSSQVVSTGRLRVKGHGTNMGIYFYSNTDREDAHSFSGITTQYSLRALER